MTSIRVLALLFASALPTLQAQHPSTPTDKVLVVTMDGVRWQEVFGGAARELISENRGGVADTLLVLRRFWRKTPGARR